MGDKNLLFVFVACYFVFAAIGQSIVYFYERGRLALMEPDASDFDQPESLPTFSLYSELPVLQDQWELTMEAPTGDGGGKSRVLVSRKLNICKFFDVVGQFHHDKFNGK